jgi:putative phage-type endonuclease
MKQFQAAQGSPEWHAYRATVFNASDAAAMLGCSPHKSRDDLLMELHAGITDEPNRFQQRRYDEGHEFEALARARAQEILGEDLYPVVGAADFGLARMLSASFDGLTMAEDTNWEHKRLNADLRAVLPHTGPDGNDASQLPKFYRVQMEQQLMVSKAQRTLFSATEWEDGVLRDERHCWYTSDEALRAEILGGWKQLQADLATYQPRPAAQPAPVGRAPESLPALHIELRGEVTASNLTEFREHALAVFGGINRNLVTDNDFADAEKTAKWCSGVEERLAAAKEHALSQTSSIDRLFKTLDEIAAEARNTRLELTRLVDAKKKAIRADIVEDGKKAYDEHVAKLNARLGEAYMPALPVDFASAISGKKTVKSLQDAVDAELARAKIAANEVADRIELNLRHLREKAKDHATLFPDTSKIVLKAPEDLQALVTSRIGEHERLAAERRQREEEQRQAEAQRQDAAPQALATATPAPAYAPAANPATVVPMQRAAAPASPPSLKLGDISARLGFVVTADFLQRLGFPPAAKERAACLYHEADFPRICDALVAHIRTVQQQRAAA